ncbi:MAG: ATP-binding protein [Saprospiraceae bacterium]
MDSDKLIGLIRGGETSRTQFKENFSNALSASQELVAFANTEGGQIIVGVNDKAGAITGLTFEDIQRISSLLVNVLQTSGDLYAEEMLLSFSIADELDTREFREFYEAKYQAPLEETDLPRVLANLRLADAEHLNVAGALLFAKHPEKVVPQFFISAVWFVGTDIAGERYHNSEDIRGTLSQLFQRGLDFLKRALHRPQNGKDFNSLGDLEIPEIVLKELLVNALIHRDYFIRDSIKLFVFDDRIEIRSPGKLPNNLTEAQIRAGIRRSRNTILDSLASDVLPYRGIGSGILRALKAWPHIQFVNDREAEQFTATIFRPSPPNV